MEKKEKENAHKVLVRKPEEKRPIGNPRSRRDEDNSKMDRNERGQRAWTKFLRLRVEISSKLL
jgi:hypothetical protein